jgi:hypothetical protein
MAVASVIGPEHLAHGSTSRDCSRILEKHRDLEAHVQLLTMV